MIIKSLMGALALATIAVASPAMADSFTGPRVEVTAGYDNTQKVVSPSGFVYGVEAGYDVKLGRVTVGPEFGVDNVFDRRDINAGGRVGFELNSHTLVYGEAGWSNVRNANFQNIDGIRVAGGVAVNVVGPVYATVGYRYEDLGSQKQHNVVAGVGYRF